MLSHYVKIGDNVKIYYKDNDTKEYINNNSKVKKDKGTAVAKKLNKCLTTLAYEENLKWLVVKRVLGTHQLTGDREEQFAMSLDKKVRLIFEVKKPIPRKDDHGIDLERVFAIQINEIKDYH